MSNAVIEDLLKLRSIIEQRDAEIAALKATLDESERRTVTIMGNLCHELRVNAPGEDAVANWQTVMDDVACLRNRYVSLQAATRKLVEAAHIISESHPYVYDDLRAALADPVIAKLRRE